MGSKAGDAAAAAEASADAMRAALGGDGGAAAGGDEDDFLDRWEQAHPDEDAGPQVGSSADEGSPDGEEAPADDEPDDGEDVQPQRQAPARNPIGRVTKKLVAAERENADLRRRIAELEGAPRDAPSDDDPEDRVELVRSRIARRLGAKPDDRRVTQELEELMKDLAYELNPNPDERIAEERDRRRRAREELSARTKREREIQRQLDEIKQQREQAQREQVERAAVAKIIETVDADDFPYLAKGDPDAARTILAVMLEAARNGEIVVRTDEDAAAAMVKIAGRLDRWHRQTAERYGATSRPTGKQDPRPNGKTKAGAGKVGSGRGKGAQAQQAAQEPEDEDAWLDRWAAANNVRL